MFHADTELTGSPIGSSVSRGRAVVVSGSRTASARNGLTEHWLTPTAGPADRLARPRLGTRWLGTGRFAAGRLGGGHHGCPIGSATRSTPIAVHDPRADQVPAAQFAAARDLDRAVDLRRLVRRATDDRVLVDLLDQHLEPGPDPVLGTLRDEFVGQRADPRDPLGDHVGVELAVEADRVGALFVGVAEHADRVQPGGGQKALQLGDVGLGLAREADDHVAARAEIRGDLPRPGEQIQERVRRRRSASSGAARVGTGVLEGQVEVRRDARGRGDRLEQRRPQLGGLQVGHPDPLDAVDAGELGPAASPAPAGRPRSLP